MNVTLTQTHGQTVKTTLIDINKPYANITNSTTSYKDIPTPVQLEKTTTILHTKPHNRKWNPKNFVYTD